MTIKISVNGARGRLGQMACKALEGSSLFTLVGQLGRDDDLVEHCKMIRPDVILNVVPASAVLTTTQKIIQAGVRVVVGASGLTDADVRHLSSLCVDHKVSALVAPNFSVSAVLLMAFSRFASRHFNHCEIVETHHDKKQDAPSGTSLRTAELIAETRQQAPVLNRHETLVGARGTVYHGVPIHSLRLPGVHANQTVVFQNDHESLTLRHDVFNREAYLPGILLACQAVMRLDQLEVGLEGVVLAQPFPIGNGFL